MPYRARMDIGTVIAGLALLISAQTWWSQRKSSGRAHFTAEWEDGANLVYVNHGPGAARDVRVKLETRFTPVDKEIPYIGPFQSHRIHYLRTVGEEPPTKLDLSWKDNRARRQSGPIYLTQAPRTEPRTRPTSEVEKVLRDLAADEALNQINRGERRKRTNRGYRGT